MWEGSIRRLKDTGHLLKSELHLPDENHVLLPYQTYLCNENDVNDVPCEIPNYCLGFYPLGFVSTTPQSKTEKATFQSFENLFARVRISSVFQPCCT